VQPATFLILTIYPVKYEVPFHGVNPVKYEVPFHGVNPVKSMNLFTKAILNDQPIKVFNNGNMLVRTVHPRQNESGGLAGGVRDFTYVDDIVEGVVRVIDSPPTDLNTVHDSAREFAPDAVSSEKQTVSSKGPHPNSTDAPQSSPGGAIPKESLRERGLPIKTMVQ